MSAGNSQPDAPNLPNPRFLAAFELRTPEDDSDRRLLADVAAYGFHIVGIQNPTQPDWIDYVFTVGCYYTFGIPEIVLFGKPMQPSITFMHAYVAWVRRLQPPGPHARTTALANTELVFRSVHRSWEQPLLGFAQWFYRNSGIVFPCFQMAWPDHRGIFDFEAGFDDRLRALQPDLSKPPTSEDLARWS